MKQSLTASKPLAAGWLLLVVAVVILALGRGFRFDSSILALLPASEQQPLVQQAGDSIGDEFSSRMLLLISGEQDETVRAAVRSIAAEFAGLEQIENITWRIEPEQLNRLRNELFAYRYVLLDDDLRQMLLAGEQRKLARQALLRWFGPVTAGAGTIVDDPFGLYVELQKNRPGGLNLEVSDSLLQVSSGARPAYLLTLELADDPFSPALQRVVLDTIAAERENYGENIEIRMSGMLMHAAAGAKQARTEISTIGLGSLVGISIAILWIFRHARPLLLLLLPVTIGCAFAAAATLLFFDRIHLITLAFGAGLVGVSIDYALHFLAERRYSHGPAVLPKILGGLMLGLFSSLMAYAVMILTPFPGLRQMAVFSVAGLFASWVSVVLWFPLLTRKDEIRPIGMALDLNRLRSAFPRIDNNRWIMLVLAVLSGLALVSIWNSSGRDDIRLLQTSPPALLAQEKEVHRALGSASSSQYLLVNAENLEQCLQMEEKLAPVLDALVAAGSIEGYSALSDFLPSLERQSQNHRLVEQLYRDQLEDLYQILKLPAARLRQARDEFRSGADKRLTEAAWRELELSRRLPGFIVDTSDSTALTVIRFTGVLDAEARAELEKLAAADAGLYFVDQVENVSQLMKKYRSQIGKWLIIAYLIVLAVLLLRYRLRLWRVVLPPLLASIFTLAILVQVEQGINLFHLMALILVLGIGLDMGIFLTETDEAEQTWLAVSLSTYTSLLAFGLLALSKTPVLHHFGLTVAIGLSLVWLLAPMVRDQRMGDEN